MATREEVAQRLGQALLDALELAANPARPASNGDGPTPLPVALLTYEDVAARLSLGLTSVKALIRTGELQRLHAGRSPRIASTDVDAYIARLRDPSRELAQGESPPPIDIGRPRRPAAASSAARQSHRAANSKKARASR